MLRLISAAVLVSAILAIAAGDVELYSDKFDHLDAAAILQDDALRNEYYNCFMDTGPCVTDAAKFFKGNFPEAVVTRCAKCTARQIEMFTIVVEWYNENNIEEWNALMVKLINDAKAANLVP